MVARIYNKKLLILCDSIDCKNKSTWRQGFITESGMSGISGIIVVDLCEEHHHILRAKVPNNIPLNEDVLKWLLIQDADASRVVKYGIVLGTDNIEMMKELRKIKIEYE